MHHHDQNFHLLSNFGIRQEMHHHDQNLHLISNFGTRQEMHGQKQGFFTYVFPTVQIYTVSLVFLLRLPQWPLFSRDAGLFLPFPVMLQKFVQQ